MCNSKPPAPAPVPVVDTVKQQQDAEAAKAAEAERVRRVNKGGLKGLLYEGTGFGGVQTLGSGGNTLGSAQ